MLPGKTTVFEATVVCLLIYYASIRETAFKMFSVFTEGGLLQAGATPSAAAGQTTDGYKNQHKHVTR